MTINLTFLLQVAGVLHLGLMSAGLMMPKVVNMRAHLAGLPTFIRQLFWVYYSFIALCMASASSRSCLRTHWRRAARWPGRCASSSPCSGCCVCSCHVVLDMRPYLTSTGRRVGYYVLNIVFAYLPIVYALAASQSGFTVAV
jgi:hypothetical protein